MAQRDEKVLADRNGLMIAALNRTDDIFAETDWIAAAVSAYKFVLVEMDSRDLLLHSWRAGQAQHPPIIEDSANMVGSPLTLHEATSEDAYMAQAKAWAKVTNLHHWDGIHHG